MEKKYNLEITKERDTILNVMMALLSKDPRAIMFIKGSGLMNELLEFTQEISDKSHELDWCEDPDCTYDKSRGGDDSGSQNIMSKE